MQFDDAMRSTDKEWRCRVDELKRSCDASVQRESELKRSVELESLRRREADAALKEARECLVEVQEKLRDSLWRCDDLQGQVDAHVQSRDMLAIENRTSLERMKTSSDRLLSEATATNRTLEAEAARLQDELTRARAMHAADLQRLQVLSSSYLPPQPPPPPPSSPPPASSCLQELHAHAAHDASERHGKQMREMEEALKSASAGASVLQEEWQVRCRPLPRNCCQHLTFCASGADMATGGRAAGCKKVHRRRTRKTGCGCG